MNSDTNTAFLAIDLGNSRLKICSDLDNISFIDLDVYWQQSFKNILNSFKDEQVEIKYCSSNPKVEEQIKNIVRDEINIKFTDVRNDLDESSKVEYKHIGGIGTDRVLAINYLAQDENNVPFIFIDCGTALTITVVNFKSKCLGGAILPGLYTQFKSLNYYTTSLPKVGLPKETLIIGRNTEEAIQVGVLNGLGGAVHSIIQEIIKDDLPNDLDNELDKELDSELENEEEKINISGAYAQEIYNLLQSYNYSLTLHKDLLLKALMQYKKLD